jgi:hypothetical protein
MEMIMKTAGRTALLGLPAILLCALVWSSGVLAQSSYFSAQGCSSCHAAPVVATCNGCHAHGTHPNSSKSTINVAGTTNKSSYAPGEPVIVTITGGYRTGWFRAALFDQNMVELARTTGNDSGMGSSAAFPVVLTASAPATSGNYSWKVAWYGNQYDASGAAFGPDWTLDPNNPNHGYEIVSITTPFTVTAPVTPTVVEPSQAVPAITSVSPANLAQGTINQIVTINGTNLTGASVSFSNTGINGGQATVTATSISLPVTIAANAAIGAGIVTVTTANGSVPAFFSVTDASIPAPAISAVSPATVVQGAVNQIVTITGANLTDATVSFSNGGVIGGPVTATATSLTLPVIVAANAATGSGTITVSTVGGTVSSAFSVSLRSSGPALIISALSDGSYTNNPTLNISGTVTAATGIQSVVVNNQFVTVMPNGYFSTALMLVVGANTVMVNATDNAGTLKSDSRTIFYDPNAPILTISAPPDNSTVAASFITISGNVNETSTVSVTINNGSPQYSSITGNAFSISVNLTPGVNTVTVAATDLAGNTASAKRTINYDASTLTLAVTNPSQDMTTNLATMILMGTVTNSSKEITVTITMDGQTYTYLVTNGIFKQSLTFTAAKQYVITVSAVDAAGNRSSVTRNVIYSPVATGGTGAASHPFGWTNPKSSHQNYVESNGVNSCLSCHSIDAASKGQPMSCYNCHNQKWTTPPTGGVTTGSTTGGTTGSTTSHPFGWTNPQSSHQNYVESNGTAECISCHSIDAASKGQAMSCYNCHGKKW